MFGITSSMMAELPRPLQLARRDTPTKASRVIPRNLRRAGVIAKLKFLNKFLLWDAAAFAIWAYAFEIVISPWMSFFRSAQTGGSEPVHEQWSKNAKQIE